MFIDICYMLIIVLSGLRALFHLFTFFLTAHQVNEPIRYLPDFADKAAEANRR